MARPVTMRVGGRWWALDADGRWMFYDDAARKWLGHAEGPKDEAAADDEAPAPEPPKPPKKAPPPERLPGTPPVIAEWQQKVLAGAASPSEGSILSGSAEGGLRDRIRGLIRILSDRDSSDHEEVLRALVGGIQAKIDRPIVAFTIVASRGGFVADVLDSTPVVGWIARKVGGGARKDALYLLCVTNEAAHLFAFMPALQGRRMLDFRLFDIEEVLVWPRATLRARVESSPLPGFSRLVLTGPGDRQVGLEMLDERLGREMGEPVVHLLSDPAATL